MSIRVQFRVPFFPCLNPRCLVFLVLVERFILPPMLDSIRIVSLPSLIWVRWDIVRAVLLIGFRIRFLIYLEQLLSPSSKAPPVYMLNRDKKAPSSVVDIVEVLAVWPRSFGFGHQRNSAVLQLQSGGRPVSPGHLFGYFQTLLCDVTLAIGRGHCSDYLPFGDALCSHYFGTTVLLVLDCRRHIRLVP